MGLGFTATDPGTLKGTEEEPTKLPGSAADLPKSYVPWQKPLNCCCAWQLVNTGVKTFVNRSCSGNMFFFVILQTLKVCGYLRSMYWNGEQIEAEVVKKK